VFLVSFPFFSGRPRSPAVATLNLFFEFGGWFGRDVALFGVRDLFLFRGFFFSSPLVFDFGRLPPCFE